MEKEKVKEIIVNEIRKIENRQIHLSQGCVACHVIMTLSSQLQKSEQDSADIISEILTEDSQLNERFIGTVEQVHMKERNLGESFALRQRESKDAYLDAYFENVIDELGSDLIHTEPRMVLRKVILSYLGLYMAQTIGVDYHAATEELYYLLRKDSQKNKVIDDLISKISQSLAR